MNLSFLRLKNYRNISDCTIDFSRPITTIIGRNNSGKSSVLDAIFACLSKIELPGVINRNLRTGETIIEVGFYLSPEEWHKFFRETGYPQFFLTLEECKELQTIQLKKRCIWTIKNGNMQAKNELILPSLLGSVKYSKYSEHFSELQKIGNKNLALMFGVVKMSPAGQQLSISGNFIPYNTIKPEEIIKQINVWLLHIKRKFPEEYKQFLNEFKSLFPELDSFDIFFDQDTGNVRLEITEKGNISNISQMGSGFHSTLMLFSYLSSEDFKIVIVDEPCAHMHTKLIRLMAKYLKRISENKQLIIATHNSAFINYLPLSSISYLSENKDGKFSLNSLDKPYEFWKILEELGIKVSDDLIFDLNTFENTKAAQILVENVNPKIRNHYAPVLDYLGDKALSYYPKSDISIGGLPKDSKAYNLMVELKDCPLGSKGWVRYQRICSDILSYVFSPPLSKPFQQSETEGRDQRRDLIIHIPFNIGDFWGWIQTEHKSIAVIVECKNHKEPISKDEVTKTSSYFSEKKLGKFGLLLSRKGLDNGGKKEINRLWNDSKIMIIPLKDDDLISLLKIRTHGGQPEVYIDEYYRKFRMLLY